ncbi:MAG: choice-of-anchor tandem repeat NxxGxxAF-containing protein [Chthoniobacteraceae bacterium]
MKTIRLLAFLVLSTSSVLLAAGPSVQTDMVGLVGSTAARVSCTLDMGGAVGDVSFEFGTTMSLGSETPARRLSNKATSYRTELRPLTPSTPYFFRAKLVSGGNTFLGNILDFTTTAGGGGTTLTPRIVAVVGQPVTNDGNGATYARLTLAEGPFAGTMQIGKTKVRAIFAGDGSVRIKVGDSAPGIADSVIVKLGVPSGDAVLAKLKPGAGAVTANDSDVLIAGLKSGPVRVAARRGQTVATPPVSGDITSPMLDKFGAIDGNGDAIFFVAKLKGTAVTPKSSDALCAALGDGSVRVVVRKGEDEPNAQTTVKTVGTLVGAKGTLAEGRWRQATDLFGGRLSFTSARAEGLVSAPATAANFAALTQWVNVQDFVPIFWNGGTIKSIGIPGFGPSGPAFVATLAPDTRALAATSAAAMTKTNSTVIMRADRAGVTVVAQKGGSAPDAMGTVLPGSTFKTFGAPVSGNAGFTAFTAQLSGPKGAAATGIWHGTSDTTLKLLARGGDTAPGGGTFASFSSLVLPDGATSGPIFTGKLAVNKGAGITAANNLGIWAVNTTGVLIGLLRTGDQIAGVAGQTRTIKSFVALQPAPGSIGAANGYDNAGKLATLVTFTDKTIALVEFTIP